MSKPVKRRVNRPARGTLMTIAILLMGSATLRIGLSANEALARETPHDAPRPAETERATCEPDENLGEMLEAFQVREARIKEQELQIKKRMQALALADKKIEEKLAALQQSEAALRSTIAIAQTAAEDDLSKLTTVYESMKPKDASALFEQMDPDFSAGFLGRMKPSAAAAIMAGLSAEKAYTISVILAGRNANAPTE